MKSIDEKWRDFNDYLKRHPEMWDVMADKLWGDFVYYKDVPFGIKETRYEQKN